MTHSPSSRRSSTRNRRRRLQAAIPVAPNFTLERLELRQLLSASLFDGVLNISDGTTHDAITVSQDGKLIDVDAAGKDSSFTASKVKDITIHGSHAGDHVSITGGLANSVTITPDGNTIKVDVNGTSKTLTTKQAAHYVVPGLTGKEHVVIDDGHHSLAAITLGSVTPVSAIIAKPLTGGASYTVTTGPLYINDEVATQYTITLATGVDPSGNATINVTGNGYFDFSNSSNVTATSLTLSNTVRSASFYFTGDTPGAYTSLNFSNNDSLTDPSPYSVYVNDIRDIGGYQIYQTIANGNWSSPSTWQGGFVPGLTAATDSADVMIYNNVTVDQNVTIGTAPDVQTCLNIGVGYNLTIDSGVTLTLRNNAEEQGYLGTVQAVTFDSGSALVFDSTQLATPSTNLTFTSGDGYEAYQSTLAFDGTSASPVTVSSVAGGGVGIFASANDGGGFITATYTNFRNIGSSTELAFNPDYIYAPATFSLTNCTFNTCGEVAMVSSDNTPGEIQQATANYVINNDSFTNTQSTYSVYFEEGVSLTTGTWSVSNDNSDKSFDFVNSVGLTQTGNTTGNVTGYTVSNPGNGADDTYATFTVSLNTANNLPAAVTITPVLVSGSGNLSAAVTLSNTTRSGTFTFYPAAGSGPAVITTTESAGNMVVPAPMSFLPNANNYTMVSHPTTGNVGCLAGLYTLSLSAAGDYSAGLVITPSVSVGSGTFSPTSATLTTAVQSASFTFTPSGSAGTDTLNFNNSGGFTVISEALTVSSATAAPTSFTLSGPANGTIEAASTNFTVTLGAGSVTGTDVFTPSATNDNYGYFTPATLSLTNYARSGTFTYTPSVYGTRTITVNDNVSLTAQAASFVGIVQTGVTTWGPTGVQSPDITGVNFFANGYLQDFAPNVQSMSVDPNSTAVTSFLDTENETLSLHYAQTETAEGGDNATGYPIAIVPQTQPVVPVETYISANSTWVQDTELPYPSNMTIEDYYSATLPEPTTTNGNDMHALLEVVNNTTGGISNIYEGMNFYQNGSEGAEWVMTQDDGSVVGAADINITSGAEPPEGVGFADARSGVALTPLLLDYSQVAYAEQLGTHAGVGHELEFVLPNAVMVNDVYVWPAKSGSYSGGSQQNDGIDYGAVLRLSSSWYDANAASYQGQARVVIDTLFKSGMILVDGANGPAYIKSATDDRWDTTNLATLTGLPMTDFQLVTETPQLVITGPTTGVVGQAAVFSWHSNAYSPVALTNYTGYVYTGVTAGTGSGTWNVGDFSFNSSVTSGTITFTPKTAGTMTFNPTQDNQWLITYPTLFTALPTDEVGDWPLNEGSGTVAHDISPSGNNGTLGSTATWSANGVNGSALSVIGGGTSDVTASDAALPTGASARTVSLWVNTTPFNGASGTLYGMFEYGTASSKEGFALSALNNGTNWVVEFSDWGGTPAGTIPLIADAWNHIAATYDGTTVRLYVNGVADTTLAVTLATTGGSLYLGQFFDSDVAKALINDVQVYNDAWTATQISNQYSQSSMVSDWSFNQTTGTVATDTSGSNNTITFGTAATWATGGINSGDDLTFNSSKSYPYAYTAYDAILPAANAPRTVALWFNTTGLAAAATYALVDYGASSYSGTDNEAFEVLLTHSGSSYYLQWSSQGQTVTGAIALTADAWNHLAVSYNGSTITLFVNGTQDTSSAVTALATNTVPHFEGSNLWLNGLFGSVDEPSGIYDDLRIYDEGLTAAQVEAIP